MPSKSSWPSLEEAYGTKASPPADPVCSTPSPSHELPEFQQDFSPVQDSGWPSLEEVHGTKLTTFNENLSVEPSDEYGNTSEALHFPGAMKGSGIFLEPEDMKVFMTSEPSGHCVPNGLKQNVYFLLNDNNNLLRRSQKN
ncbi:uncharacterized protein LOC117109063 [Anneissia japonica]|uniref:uncharacterized protein LOC117109063 n=1 Tax=Anneissia japonica TaxID=1529436 RepID=UPI00142560FE|nr:uncharacterized protein LOC117109063 [Anneissia japonica]